MADKLDLDVGNGSQKSPEQDVLIKDVVLILIRFDTATLKKRLKNLKKCLKLQVQIFILY